jgi:SAM-dependent methyltransferase
MAVTDETIKEHFDEQSRRGRRLLPDPNTVGGLGSYLKYSSVVGLMASPEFHSILDLGCNRGSVEYLYETSHPRESLSGKRVVAGDVSWVAVKQAKALELKRARFLVCDGCFLPFGAESFDLVLLVEVVEHIIDKRALLAEVARTLRPGGHLLLTTPNPNCWALHIENATWRGIRTALRKHQVLKDIYIDAASLQEYLKAEGFRILNQDNLYSWPHAFVHFRRWSILPLLSPSLWMRYQRLWLRVLDNRELPQFLAERLMWTINVHAELC